MGTVSIGPRGDRCPTSRPLRIVLRMLSALTIKEELAADRSPSSVLEHRGGEIPEHDHSRNHEATVWVPARSGGEEIPMPVHSAHRLLDSAPCLRAARLAAGRAGPAA